MKSVNISRALILMAKTALLSALSIVLSIFESMLPDFPFVLPGMKLGLSNISILIGVEFLPLPLALCVATVKALFALISRGATAFFMSLAGSLLSTLAMYLAVRIKKPRFGCMGIGILGAFTHNLGQIIAAFAIAGQAVLSYFPVLALFSLVTGSVTGLLYYLILPPIRRLPLINQ